MKKQAVASELKIKVDELKEVLNLLSQLFDVRTAFLYETAFNPYTKEVAGEKGQFRPFCNLIQTELKARCIACDSRMFEIAAKGNEPVLYRCDNGLYEMFLPMSIDNCLIGYLHFGQVRADEAFEEILSECNLKQHTRWRDLKAYYEEMNIVPLGQLIKISKLFQKMAESILRDNLIEIKKANPIFYVEKFIKENARNKITIKDIAQNVGRSESYIVHEFKKAHNISIHEYIVNCRILLAQTLLKSKTIDEAFEECGFKNRYHFSRMFKKVTGNTPKQYQREFGR